MFRSIRENWFKKRIREKKKVGIKNHPLIYHNIDEKKLFLPKTLQEVNEEMEQTILLIKQFMANHSF